MNKQSVLIYKFPSLFNILNEIKENFNFELFNISEINLLNENNDKKYGNYLVITQNQNKLPQEKNQIIISNLPLKIEKIINLINVELLKNNYNKKSFIDLGFFKLNYNSREIFKDNKKLKLTEREIEIILFLKNSSTPQKIENLQKKVWGHNLALETHTVETHIYRLRKKINNFFAKDDFIVSTKNGYEIK